MKFAPLALSPNASISNQLESLKFYRVKKKKDSLTPARLELTTPGKCEPTLYYWMSYIYEVSREQVSQ